MKKLLIYTFIVFLSIFTFNLNVQAQEIDNDNSNLISENETSNSKSNESDEIEIINTEENTELVEEDTELKDEEILVQHTGVKISKVNEKGEHIIGAKLQILDLEGNVIEEWISDGNVYETELPGGKYILHEVEAPEGYILAEDKEFEIEVVIEETIIGDVDWNKYPCDHGEDNQTPLYYVEINNVSYEVYCINQGLKTPNGNTYNGEIIKPEDLREFTKQETNIDAEGYTISGSRINVNTQTVSDYDVSDQTLTDQQLYDKVLDIIYHRYLAEKDIRFSGLTVAEIRFITEFALKNYLNARITTYETVRELVGTKTNHISYNENGELWQTGDGKKYIKLYNKFYNREYLYDVNSPTGYIISAGNGDAFGNLAKHWYGSHGKVKIPGIYAELFYYLISDENNHPEDMKLYMYSPTTRAISDPYQNLLGITGFLEDVEIKEQIIEMIDEYISETRDITVVKVWDDEESNKTERPKKVTINLYADGKLHETVELNNDNNWTYTFEDLDVYKEGKKIVYTIDEVAVPQYETEIKGDMEEGFVITNTHHAQGSIVPPIEELDTPITNPETKDNIYINILMIIGSIIGLFSLSLYTKLN